MQRHMISYLTPAIPLLVSGVACLAIGLASETKTFLWMAPGFLGAGLVLMLLGLRRRGH
jgi:hypothetical protein